MPMNEAVGNRRGIMFYMSLWLIGLAVLFERIWRLVYCFSCSWCCRSTHLLAVGGVGIGTFRSLVYAGYVLLVMIHGC